MLLDWESPIAARLEAAGLPVRRASAADAVDRQAAPVVHVVYAGYSARDAGVAASQLTVRWMMVVATRNVRAAAAGADARLEASPMVQTCIEALLGWHPPGAGSPLRLVDAPEPYYEAGYLAIPIVFAASQVVRQAFDFEQID